MPSKKDRPLPLQIRIENILLHPLFEFLILLLLSSASGSAVVWFSNHEAPIKAILSGLILVLVWIGHIQYGKLAKRRNQMRLDVLHYVMAFRQFEENVLSDVDRGSQEWFRRVTTFEETVHQEENPIWEQLFQEECLEAADEYAAKASTSNS